MKRACTILLRTKKIKKFISLFYKGLYHFAKFFTPDFRMKHASLCKGGGVTLFAPPKTGVAYKRKTERHETQLNKIKNPLPLAPIYVSLFTLHFSCPPPADKKNTFYAKRTQFQD